MGNFDTGPFVSGFGKVFRPNGHSLVCFSSFKEVEHHCVFNLQIIFTAHSYYAETYPSLWVVFRSSEVSIHAFTTSVHCLAFFWGATNSLELRMLYNTRTDSV